MAASHSSPHHSGNQLLSAKFIKGKMIISPKDLNIVWGNDNRYWNVPTKENLAADLHQVCWLEATSLIHETSPGKNYEVGFRVSFNPDAFGWGKYPIYIMAKRGKEGKIGWAKIYMNPDNHKGGHEFEITGKSVKSEKPSQDDGKLYFGLYEVWSGKWKGGLKIHHAFIRELP